MFIYALKAEVELIYQTNLMDVAAIRRSSKLTEFALLFRLAIKGPSGVRDSGPL
jgi:hypothetical protein